MYMNPTIPIVTPVLQPLVETFVKENVIAKDAVWLILKILIVTAVSVIIGLLLHKRMKKQWLRTNKTVALRLQILRRAFPSSGRALLMGKNFLQNAQHGGRIVPHLGNILLQHRIQKIRPHMVGGTARQSPHMVGSAGVGFGKVFAAHGEHRAAAIPAEQESGIGVVVFLDAAVIVLGALLQQLLRSGKGAVVHNRLVVIFKDDMFICLIGFCIDSEPPLARICSTTHFAT